MSQEIKTTILKPVFIPSVLFIVILVVFTMIMPQVASDLFSSVKGFVAEKFDYAGFWFGYELILIGYFLQE